MFLGSFQRLCSLIFCKRRDKDMLRLKMNLFHIILLFCVIYDSFSVFSFPILCTFVDIFILVIIVATTAIPQSQR